MNNLIVTLRSHFQQLPLSPALQLRDHCGSPPPLQSSACPAGGLLNLNIEL